MVVESLELISVAEVAAGKSPVEVLHGLVGITAFRVQVVEHRACLGFGVDISRETSRQQFLGVFPAAGTGESHQSHRYPGVVESGLVVRREPVFHGITEIEIA